MKTLVFLILFAGLIAFAKPEAFELDDFELDEEYENSFDFEVKYVS